MWSQVICTSFLKQKKCRREECWVYKCILGSWRYISYIMLSFNTWGRKERLGNLVQFSWLYDGFSIDFMLVELVLLGQNVIKYANNWLQSCCCSVENWFSWFVRGLFCTVADLIKCSEHSKGLGHYFKFNMSVITILSISPRHFIWQL